MPSSNEVETRISNVSDDCLASAENLLKELKNELDANRSYGLGRQLLKLCDLTLEDPRLLVYAHWSRFLYALLELPSLAQDPRAPLIITINTCENDAEIQFEFDEKIIQRNELKKVMITAGRDAPHHLMIRVPRAVPLSVIDFPAPISLSKLLVIERKQVWQSCSQQRPTDVWLVTNGAVVQGCNLWSDPSEYEGPRIDSERVIKLHTGVIANQRKASETLLCEVVANLARNNGGLEGATYLVDFSSAPPISGDTYEEQLSNTRHIVRVIKEKCVANVEATLQYSEAAREVLLAHIGLPALRSAINKRFRALLICQLETFGAKVVEWKRILLKKKAKLVRTTDKSESLQRSVQRFLQAFAQRASADLTGNVDSDQQQCKIGTSITQKYVASMEENMIDAKDLERLAFSAAELQEPSATDFSKRDVDCHLSGSKDGKTFGRESFDVLLDWTSAVITSLKPIDVAGLGSGLKFTLDGRHAGLLRVLRLSACLGAVILRRTLMASLEGTKAGAGENLRLICSSFRFLKEMEVLIDEFCRARAKACNTHLIEIASRVLATSTPSAFESFTQCRVPSSKKDAEWQFDVVKSTVKRCLWSSFYAHFFAPLERSGSSPTTGQELLGSDADDLEKWLTKSILYTVKGQQGNLIARSGSTLMSLYKFQTLEARLREFDRFEAFCEKVLDAIEEMSHNKKLDNLDVFEPLRAANCRILRSSSS